MGKEVKAAAGQSLNIAFVTDTDKDGTAKITAGRKHRFREEPNPDVGRCIGTLYIDEHAFIRMGRPSKFTMELRPDGGT